MSLNDEFETGTKQIKIPRRSKLKVQSQKFSKSKLDYINIFNNDIFNVPHAIIISKHLTCKDSIQSSVRQ